MDSSTEHTQLSASSNTLVDAIVSYNRSQHQVNAQSGMPSSYSSGFVGPFDCESALEIYESEFEEDVMTPRPYAELRASPFEDFNRNDRLPPLSGPCAETSPDILALPRIDEQSPLLHRLSNTNLRRRASTAALVRHRPPGRSTFKQTLFNASAILLGVGMLSEPLAFASAGWIVGTLLVVLYGYITCYTAKFLGRVIIQDTRLWSYADIGLKAFGPTYASFISVLFCLEVFTICVILVTLLSDSLYLVMPSISPDIYKVLTMAVLIPAVFLPLWLLSYTSLMGILSTVGLLLVIVVDGFSKAQSPGSLLDPSETNFLFGNWKNLGFAFGLFMAGFGAHAAMPSLAADMEDPSRFEEVMNWAFTFATVFYAFIGAAGYLMFGDVVGDEITQNLFDIPGYNSMLNKAVIWMLIVASLTKVPLAARPANITLEVVLGLVAPYTPSDTPLSDSKVTSTALVQKASSRHALKRMLFIIERTSFIVVSVAISILFPDFSVMMAILGAFSTFLICVIGPLLAKLRLEGRNAKDVTLLAISIPMAALGTTVAFLSE